MDIIYNLTASAIDIESLRAWAQDWVDHHADNNAYDRDELAYAVADQFNLTVEVADLLADFAGRERALGELIH